MTREEAKNSLVNTKVYVAGKSAEIQKKLFELGFKWRYEGVKVGFENIPFLYIYEDIITHGSDMRDFLKHDNKEVTADYILGLTWEEKTKFQPFDKVLARDGDDENWRPALYYVACDVYGRECWRQILPYEGNEHLAHTNNNPE